MQYAVNRFTDAINLLKCILERIGISSLLNTMHLLKKTTLVLFLLLVGFFAVGLTSCTKTEIADNVSFTKVPDWVIGSAAVPLTLLNAEHQAPLFFPKYFSHTRFHPDGKIHRYNQFVIKGNQADVLLNEARQGFVLNPAFEALEVHFFGVHRDGQAIDLKQKIKPQISSLQSDLPGVYLGQVQVVFEMPEVRPSDILDIRFSIIGTNPVFGKKPWYLQTWHSLGPTLERVHEVSWHSSMPIQVDVLPSSISNRWSASENASLTRRSDGDWTTVRYSGVNLPQARFDEQIAQGTVPTDLIQATAFKDWGEVRIWGRALFEKPPKPSSQAYQALLNDLRGLASPQEQAVAALRWVQREVRYVSLSLAENSHLPYASDEVLKRRFGDCKDKTLLLTYLLRDLGIEASPALMNLHNTQLPSKALPAPLFDHAVVAVWINKRMYVLMQHCPSRYLR